MTPNETIVVPAEVVIQLRIGLYAHIGIAAEELDLLTMKADRARHPERYHKPLGDLDRVRSLLDEIGWQESDPAVLVELDLGKHRWALHAALETTLQTIGDGRYRRAGVVQSFLARLHAQERG